MRVLVVDDHSETRAFLVRALGSAAHAVRSSSTAAEAEFELTCSGHRFDAAVLDVMLPDESGLALCARLRSRSVSVPILWLTARGDVRDRVRGFEAGADDAVPVSQAEGRGFDTRLPLKESREVGWEGAARPQS